MYEHIQQILLKSKIATKLDAPVWMSQDNKIVDDEMDAFGYQ